MQKRSYFLSRYFLIVINIIPLCIVAWLAFKPIPLKTADIQVHQSTFPDSVTHHVQIINGKKYAYTTTVGTIILEDAQHHPTATMSYTANVLDNIDAIKRPITFFYNGGPGSSAMLLRMASFGPKRVILNNHAPVSPAPYKLVDNKYTLLDKTDLVFIDMPGTGFGRLLGKSKPADFYGVDKDANAFTSFIQTYINTNHRWNSPKYLFGESYGTTRTAILANKLQQQGMQINGVILLSSILNYGLMDDHEGIGDWGYILYLPSFAASAWYFHQASYHPESIDVLLKEVEHFALTEYLEALAQGSKLPPERFHAIAKKLEKYLGINASYIEENNLRLATKQFSSILLSKKNLHLGRYDARFTISSLGKPFRDSLESNPDSTMVTIKNCILTMTKQYYSQDLHYSNSLDYLPKVRVYKQWNFKHEHQRIVNSAHDLSNAMIINPYLRVFSANGYYDFATPFFATIYTFNHLVIPESLEKNITIKNYSGGHMIYLDPKSLAQLKEDLDKWYDEENFRHP